MRRTSQLFVHFCRSGRWQRVRENSCPIEKCW